MKKKATATTTPDAPEVPILSLAEAEKLSVADTVSQFAGRVQSRRRMFVEQGKLVYHLDNVKLPRGQSIYSILKAGGIPEGSVQQARMTADCIAELVIPGHLTEARFDELITYRIARQARRLFQGKAAVTMTTAEVAAILATGNPAAIGEELDCLCEHGMTISARETALAEKQAEAEREKAAAAKADAEEARKLLASRDAVLPTAAEREAAKNQDPADPSDQPDPTDPPEEEEEEETAPDESEDEEEEEEEVEDTAPEPVVVDGTKGGNKPAPAPPAKPTLAEITGRFDDVLVAAMELEGDELEKLVKFLRSRTDDMAATLQSLHAVAA